MEFAKMEETNWVCRRQDGKIYPCGIFSEVCVSTESPAQNLVYPPDDK